MKLPRYQFFGSEDSLDVDVVFFVAKMPESILEKLNLAQSCSQLIGADFPQKSINTNLACLENGCITKVYKGTADELNNALFYTYNFHKQPFENHIVKLLPRDVNLKFLRSSRMILSFLSKTNYRQLVKTALKSEVQQKIKALEQIDLSTINDFGKGQDKRNAIKSIAFQIGQSLALNNGIECYTKKQIATYFPALLPYLNRMEMDDLYDLQQCLTRYVEQLKNRTATMTIFVEYAYEDQSKL